MSDRAYIPWVIVGAGRLGTSLAYLAQKLGVEVKAAWSRSECPDGLPANVVLSGDLFELEPYLGGAIIWITVADGAIPEVAAEIAAYLRPADVVVHASGALDSSVLREAGVLGPVGSIHPLLAIADPREAVKRFEHCAWTVEGDYGAVQFGKWFLGQIGVEPYEVEADAKALYHASAVASAGLVVSLMDLAFELAEGAGFSQEEARELLLPLAESTIANLKERTPSEALTGPVARGDSATIARHRRAIEALGGDALAIYDILTSRARHLSD